MWGDGDVGCFFCDEDDVAAGMIFELVESLGDGLCKGMGLGEGEDGVENFFGVGCALWFVDCLVVRYGFFDAAIMAEDDFSECRVFVVEGMGVFWADVCSRSFTDVNEGDGGGNFLERDN